MTAAQKFEVCCPDGTLHYGPDSGPQPPSIDERAVSDRARRLDALGVTCGPHRARKAASS
ncbi:MAG: hypothetical protein JWM93_2434 [Frankiales bacterium]|nr:hypothetical protein [Frankiales bacterium]